MTAIHMYSGGQEIYWDCPFGIDEVFKHPGATLFVRNQEEKDYYSGLQLMYSQSINILTMDEWEHRKRMTAMRNHYQRTGKLCHKEDDSIHLPHTFYATYPALVSKSI